MPDGSATAHLYRPKLITIFSEGYGIDALRKDAFAAITVAIVALPLSMAIAVASGVTPERGLYTAIVGGFIVSLLGGSRVQIGGPAGAFIVLVAAAASEHGLDGLLLAVMLSGAALLTIGVLRIGALINYIPTSVIVGFSCGIAATILASQIKDLAGLSLSGPEPGHFFPKLVVLAHALPTVNWATLALGVGSAATIFLVRWWRPLWPAMLIAVAGCSFAAYVLHLPVETIGSHFGGVPSGAPQFHLPPLTWEVVARVWPAALSFTLLGGIESLLSARVADGLIGRKHRPNMELVAQGIANLASPMFGGISVTGTIARTVTNVRAGARSPIAGMLHSVALLAFMVLAAPLANFIPLSALAGVLVVVSWSMVERKEVVRLLRQWQGAVVFLATLGLTLIEDLTYGIIAGCLLAGLFTIVSRLRDTDRLDT
jgi:SulP family sulfate permease